MRILAIIPARAGSKGIPNKNIRIIGGRPMIYYAIRNAVQSNLITDVIVSTDSEEVRIIANQMGVNVHWRSQELCADDVTLDAVIYDAIPKDVQWDYIVTMQPTSPTLKTSTLDDAIENAIKTGYDTMISVINDPHLSWGEIGGAIVPNYKERLNRQYLPPCYVETGAFLISKASVVTEKTRIGSSINVYELPPNEAQDVDTFSDLRSVADTIESPRVAIYVNGNNSRGVGHVYRALELADEFFVKPDIYFDSNQTDIAVFGNTTHKLIPVNGIAELFERCKQKQYTIFINDILSTSIDYMIGLRSVIPNAKIINFEDDGEGVIKADLVFNALFNNSQLPQVHVGEKYYISGKTFMFYEPIKIQNKVERVFVSFGGADPMGYTDRVLELVSKADYKEYSFVIVLGRAKENVSELLEYNRYDNIEVLYDVANMPEVMSSCDIGITSRGRTGYELAMLGIPAISIAQNEREEKHGFVCEKNGFNYLGLNPSDEIIDMNLKMFLSLSKDSRQRYQNLMLSHDLRGGRKRVMSLINGL